MKLDDWGLQPFPFGASSAYFQGRTVSLFVSGTVIPRLFLLREPSTTRMYQEMVRINGLFHLLINGIS